MRKIAIILIVGVWIELVDATIIDIPADFPTIQQGINATSDADTVLVQPGTYVENINFNGHNIVLGSLFLTTGDTTYIGQTVIDGGSAGTVVTIENGETVTTRVIGFTIQNGLSNTGGGIKCSASSPTISFNSLIDNHSPWFGGGVYCDSSSIPLFEYNSIADNSADWGGGGLYIESSRPRLSHNFIYGNSTVAYGGGLLCVGYADAEIVNCVFYGNVAGFGGGFCTAFESYPSLTNVILWNDSASMAGFEFYTDDSMWPEVNYCDMRNTSLPGDGNIEVDPRFRDPENGDFHLQSLDCDDGYNSPCIDAGSPALFDNLLDCSWGLGTERSDMGAYGGGDSTTTAIDDYPGVVPSRFAFPQNYPNPFNASTTISYSLPEQEDVRIDIYNILGRRVATLFDGEQQAGNHEIVWRADEYPSGVYFARLSAGTRSENIKMLLLK